MENILDMYNNSNKTSLKHRRSHSVGFPVNVDQVFWNQVRVNTNIENIFKSDVESEKRMPDNSSKSVGLYSPKKPHSTRRKSMDSIERDQKIMVPIMHTFEQCCNYNYEEDKNLKINLNALKILQESDEHKLDKLISENKDLKNKLENLNCAIEQIKNELENLKETNYHLQDRNNYFSNKYKTMKMLCEDNIKKIEKINSIPKLLSNVENCELEIFKMHEGIFLLQNNHTMAKNQYNRTMFNIQEVNSLILIQTKVLEDQSNVGIKYFNYLKKELYVDQKDQNEYLLQNENLKWRCSELLNQLNKTNNTYYCDKKKISSLLLLSAVVLLVKSIRLI